MHHFVRWIAGGVTLLMASQASALYRCGNAYQDRPCESNVPQVQLRSSGGATRSTGPAAPAGSSSSPFAATCARMGQQALQIAWQRQAGATEARQMAELPNTGDREQQVALISAVYQRRGSAPEIRAAIEADCIAQNEKAEAAAAAQRALQRDTAGPLVSRPSENGTATRSAIPIPTGEPVTSSSGAPDNRGACQNLAARLESVKSRSAAGGNIATMDTLSRERQQLEKSRSNLGC